MKTVLFVGDSKEPRRIINATFEGASLNLIWQS
jgi:hypothetical protein